jgi:hypothetical protein
MDDFKTKFGFYPAVEVEKMRGCLEISELSGEKSKRTPRTLPH